MKLLSSFLAGVLSLFGAVVLSGCGIGATLPNSDVLETPTALGSIRGSNFGGHAPIVGAHVFVLQAGTGGYGTAATSLLTASYSNSTWPTAKDATGDFTNNDYYVTTDNLGDFNITGDYTCTPGLPVYIYASGGVSAVEPATVMTNVTYTVAGSNVTFNAGNLFSVGQYVSFASLSNANLALLGVGTYKVTAATLTSFTITGATAIGTGGTTSGLALPVTTNKNNSAIVNMAVLGNCPTSGAANFSSLSFVFLNEVSTVAEAYALSGFFSNSATALTSTDAVHLAIPLESGNGSPAWTAIQNAANNAGQLYNIQGGGPHGGSGDGEDHTANLTTPSGGTVPYALINGIADALAGCVDSGNTSAAPSTPCTTLFADALPNTSSTGTPTGTQPIDTATVAINLAHNPWNKNAATILAQSGTVVPYLPTVSSVEDLTLVISYPLAHQSTKFAGVAVDSTGSAWFTSFSDPALTKFSPLGALAFTYQFSSTNTPGDVAFDSKGNAWVAIRDLNTAYDGTYEFTSAGALVPGSPFLTTTTGNSANYLSDDIQVAIGPSDYLYFTNHPYNNALVVTTAGVAISSLANNTYTNDGPFGVAIDGGGNAWVTSNITTNSVTQWNFLTTSNTTPLRAITNIPNPEGIAIDASGNAWVSDALDGATNHNDIWEIKPGNNTAIQITGGGAENTVGMAVDGAGLVFAANQTGGANNAGSISVFNNAATPLTGANGFTGGIVSNGNTIRQLNGPYFIALDASGDLWVATNTTAIEYIGVATPVLTPLSAAAQAGKIAVRP